MRIAKVNNWLRFLAAITPILLLTSTEAADSLFLIGLGGLPGGDGHSLGHGISNGSPVVVGESTVTLSNNYGSLRWTQAGGMVNLGDLAGGAVNGAAYAVTSDGNTIVGASSSTSSGSSQFEAYRWTAGTGIVGLGDLPGGSFNSAAMGVSADASVIVGQGWSSTKPQEAFRWTTGDGMVGLGDLPGGSANSRADAVSGDGNVVVGRSSSTASGASFYEAFRWTTQTGMIGLGALPGGSISSESFATSFDGSVVVGAARSAHTAAFDTEAFRWTQQLGMVGLGDLPGGTFSSEAHAVSGDGSVVVGRGSGSSGDQAFIWDAQHGMRVLQDVLSQQYGLALTGWKLASADAISPDGLNFTGYGWDPNGISRAWVAHVPEPAMILIMPLDLALLPHRRRTRS